MLSIHAAEEPCPALRCPAYQTFCPVETIPMRSLRLLVLVLCAACASAPTQPPQVMPAGYEGYAPPAACTDSSAAKGPPIPINYDAVGRSAAVTSPDVLSRSGPPKIPFLWFFIRENGRVAETRLWRSSGSSEVDRIALDAGRQVLWRPATCGGQPVATWYGHPMAVGGAPYP